MKLISNTVEQRVDTEEEAVGLINAYRTKADEEGYIVKSSTYSRKEKKKKGEVIDEGYLVKITMIFNSFWEEV